jgi:cystathionine gamma-synthase
MSHPLHRHPLCSPGDLGAPIPDSPHAVSVCLPTWADIIGYEEKDPRVISRMRTGYPRFFIHPLVQEVRACLRREHGRPDEDVLPFACSEAARECADFCGGGARVAIADGVAAALFPKDLLPAARACWQHAGRILSSRAAEDWLRDRRLAAPEAALEGVMRGRIAAWAGVPAGMVGLHPSGMAALHAAFRAVTARRPGRRTVMFGFPYTDTLKLLQKFGAGAEFFPHGGADDLRRLEALLAAEEIAGIFCEFPGNPLLRVPDLPALHRAASAAGVPVVVDDTIGTFHNVDVLPHADFVATSLTKAVSGEGNVMAGALTANPRGIFGTVPASPSGAVYARDIAVLEANSRDFPQRMDAANATALELARFLAHSPAVAAVHYPGLHPSPVYDMLRKPGGGCGAVLSFVPRDAAVNSPRIFERLELNRGISLGTSYSLVCPYVQLAHYHELDWAADCGIDPNLLRVAVGMEPWPDLKERFERALAGI